MYLYEKKRDKKRQKGQGVVEQLLAEQPHTPYCMERSAEVIDAKGFEMAPLRTHRLRSGQERLRKHLKLQKIKEERWFA